MYIDTSHITRAGKTYTRHLLRESYRAHGKVLHRTIANVSHCSAAEIEALRLALRHKEELEHLVVSLGAADNVLRPLPCLHQGVNQPVIRTRNRFSRPRPALLACLWTHIGRSTPRCSAPAGA
jgi:hypothetical protein